MFFRASFGLQHHLGVTNPVAKKTLRGLGIEVMGCRRSQVIHPQVDGGDAVIKLAASPYGNPGTNIAQGRDDAAVDSRASCIANKILAKGNEE